MLRVKDDLVSLLNALKHQQPSVRLHAIKALMHEELEPTLALRRFTAMLGDGDEAVRLTAIQALENVGGLGVPVLARVLGGGDAPMRREAAHTLGKLGVLATPAVPALIESLKSEDRRLVQESAKALGEIGPAAHPAIDSLIALMADTHFLACRLAAWALVRIGRPAVPALVATLRDADPFVRAEAAWALAHLGPAARQAVPALTDLLRSEAAQAMCKVPKRLLLEEAGRATAPVFIASRRDRVESFWLWLIRALGNMGHEAREAVPDLLRLVRHGTGTFQLVAQQALRKIESRNEKSQGAVSLASG
jgi:HEAT repeat protein